MTEVLTVGEALLNGEPAAFLYAPPNVPDGPVRHMIVPVKADAGHLAAMAQYLTIGLSAVVYVHESAMTLLGCDVQAIDFCQNAIRRGVQADVLDDSSLVLTSGDGSNTVEIRFPAWSGELAGCEDALQLLDMAEALHRPDTLRV